MTKHIWVSLVAILAVGCATETEEPSAVATADASLSSRSAGPGFVPLVDGEPVDAADVSDCSGAAAESAARGGPSSASCSGACSFCIDDAFSCWNIFKKAKIAGSYSWNESNSTCYCVGSRSGCCP